MVYLTDKETNKALVKQMRKDIKKGKERHTQALKPTVDTEIRYAEMLKKMDPAIRIIKDTKKLGD